MKSFLVLLLLSLAGVSCSSTSSSLKLSPAARQVQKLSGYVPVDPFEYGHQVEIFKKQNSLLKRFEQCDKQEKLDFLINENVLISVLENNKGGDLSISNSFVSKKNSSYRVIMDYSKYRTISAGNCGHGRIGVGLRLVAHIKAHKSNINFGDLFSLGLAAESNHISGTLSIEVIGIKSKEITSSIPLPSEINRTSIQQAMQALSTIKSRIYDSNTSIHPQVIAIKSCKQDNTELEELVASLSQTKRAVNWKWDY